MWDMLIQNEKAAEVIRKRLSKVYRLDTLFEVVDFNHDH